MEEFVLLGSFAFTAILGYCVISKAGIWLEKIENTVRQENFQLHVAVSDLNAVPFVLNEMKRFREQYPNLRASLFVGQEAEAVKALESGTADVAILSAEAEGIPHLQFQCGTFRARPFSADGDGMEIKCINDHRNSQKMVWKNGETRCFVLGFIRRLNGQ